MFSQNYEDLCNLSIKKPEEFWDEIAKNATWNKPYTTVLEDKSSYSPKWFIGGEINMSFNCLDKAIEEGYGDDVAVIHDSPITGSTRLLTYNELLTSVELLAGVMVDRCGMKKGDIALLYFPMIPEGLISMLACTRIGVTYVIVYGGFSSKELAVRLQHTEPKLILTCNMGPEPGRLVNYKEKIDTALTYCTYTPEYCMVYNRPNFQCASMKENRDLDWTTEIQRATPHGSVPIESSHPMYIIYTSGTTGEPKGIVILTGGSVVNDIYLGKYIFGMKPKEATWSFSDFGWIIGQTVMSYVPLLTRAKTIIYEGKVVGSPDNYQFGRVLNWHKVGILFGPPTIMRMLKRYCSKSDLELYYKGLHHIFLGGEISDHRLREWLSEIFNCEVCNCWGQTEFGGGLVVSTNKMIARTNSKIDNSVTIKTPGFHFKILNKESGIEVPRGTLGRLVMKLPSIPSMTGTFYKNQERFIRTYYERYPGYYDTMDVGQIRDDGALKVEARDDDVIQVGSARICGGAVEEACLENNDILEAIAIGLPNELLGQLPFAFLVRAIGATKPDQEIISDTIRIVHDKIGDVCGFKDSVIVPELPKTRSGKTHRQSLFAMVNCLDFMVPPVVNNDHVYSVIHDTLIKAGYNSRLPK